MSEYLSIQDAADTLKVDYKVVYRLVKEGRIPAERVGWQWRIPPDGVAAYLNAERAKHAARISSGRDVQRTAYATDQAAGAATRPAAAPAELPPDAIAKLKARQMEQNFINRFNEKVADIDVIRHPATGKMIRVPSWEDCHQEIEDQEALMQALRTAFLDQPTLATTPRNVVSRYTIPGRPPLVIEARVVAHLSAFCRQGYDIEPGSLQDLMLLLDAYQRDHKQTGAVIVAGLASPTGWDREATRYVRGTGRGNVYRHPGVKPILIDLRSDLVFYDENDAVTPGFANLFVVTTEAEEIAGIAAQLQVELDDRDGLLLNSFIRATGAPEKMVLQAAERLEKSGGYHRIPDKSEGWILVKV